MYKILLGLLLCFNLQAQTVPAKIDPLVDIRYAGVVTRDTTGATARSTKTIAAFRKMWACPATHQKTGACPGWAIDHVIPLACGGVDAVYNMAWLPDQIKSSSGEFSKDRWERKVYGGNKMGPGCP